MGAGWGIAAAMFAANILIAGSAAAQPILLSGSIGKAPVFLDLDRKGDTVSGWYFYLKVGKQLRLEGKLNPGGFFDVAEYTASTNSRTGSFNGRIVNGRWSGTWTNAKGTRSYPILFREVRGKLKDVRGRYRCSVKTTDDFGTRTTHRLDLKLENGRAAGLDLRLDQSLDGDHQRCRIGTADLRQVPAPAGILFKTRADRRGSEHHCTLRLYAAGDYLVLRTGNPRQAGDDCRGAGETMFCSQRAFWLDMIVDRNSQRCRTVK